MRVLVTRPPDFSDVHAAGLYRVAPGDVHALALAASTSDCLVRRIDLADCRDKADLLARIADALEFPAWFGHNWDALADCLTDLDWLCAERYAIVLEHCAAVDLPALPVLETSFAIFDEAAQDWADRGIPMWIFADLPLTPDTAP